MSSSLDLNSDWENFCKNDGYSQTSSPLNGIDDNDDDISENDEIDYEAFNNIKQGDVPKCTDIYISTKTKIAYLSQPIDLKSTFWKLPISPYHTVDNCIIKKQMKFNSSNEDELNEIAENLKNEQYYEEQIITRIVNPDGRIKFKDIRKISVGLCKKDILSYRIKKKSAFYNCFVVILRIKHDDTFKEIHVKVFNTGKLEIPGIQTDELLDKVLKLLIEMLSPIVNQTISFIPDKNETVLINSNFSCGFYINREKLYEILKYKYHINSGYDPCSYPGIQCKFYYNKTLLGNNQSGHQPNEETIKNSKTYCKISFMIFRTGSVLIVGKCDEYVLNDVYMFIKNLLHAEYQQISGLTIQPNANASSNIKKRKIRKKMVLIE
jgi:hypothetical protein